MKDKSARSIAFQSGLSDAFRMNLDLWTVHLHCHINLLSISCLENYSAQRKFSFQRFVKIEVFVMKLQAKPKLPKTLLWMDFMVLKRREIPLKYGFRWNLPFFAFFRNSSTHFMSSGRRTREFGAAAWNVWKMTSNLSLNLPSVLALRAGATALDWIICWKPPWSGRPTWRRPFPEGCSNFTNSSRAVRENRENH